MAKRSTTLGIKKQSRHSHKTKKRVAAKKAMLSSRGKKTSNRLIPR